jgi:hypothetical protein
VSFALLDAPNTDTESLSWFTTQTRPPPLRSNTMLLEFTGRFVVKGRCTICVTVCDCAGLPSEVAVTVT